MPPAKSWRSYDGHMRLPWRDTPDTDRPVSDLTPTSGRFWSPQSRWNVPLARDGTRPDSAAKTELLAECWDIQLGVVACAPRVVFTGPGDPVELITGVNDADGDPLGTFTEGRVPPGLEPVAPDRTVAVVDLKARTVISGSRWARGLNGWVCDVLDVTDLDGDGWDSLASGLVLEREILSGSVPHVVALECPDEQFYGRRVRIPESADLGRIKRGHPGAIIGRALQTYGGVIVGLSDTNGLVVRCERSATATHDSVGITYSSVGIGRDRMSLRFSIDLIEVLAD